MSPDGILWSAEFGITSRTTYRYVTSDTIFRCGSISKSFVALAVLKLQEEGKLALNDKVADLASDLSFANPWEDSQPLRLVHLLEHTSGFNEQSARGFSVSILNVGLRDSLSFDAQARRCRWRPGDFFSYSNVNYELAAYIIEKVSGQAFDQYLHQNVLVPLNMKSASFLYTESVREGLANGHRDDGLTVVPYEHMLGRASGALNSTSLDLAHLVQLLLNRGIFNGSRVFTSESIERMERPVTGLAVRHGMFVLAMICSSILFALVWLPRKVLGYLRETSHLSVRILPLLAGLSIVTAFLIATIIPIDRLGLLNIWSAGICVLTWLFAVLTVAGLIQVLRARNWNVNACVWFHSLFTSIANAIALAYLSYWSVIGLRTWA